MHETSRYKNKKGLTNSNYQKLKTLKNKIMKLEQKHSTGYLSYGLKFVSELDKPYDEYGKQPIWTCNGITFLFGDNCLNNIETNDAYPMHLCKLILRPLSDLKKDEFYHLWSHETDFESIVKFTESDIETIESYKFSLSFWNGMHENHFDIYGLIENNLAIDINTLNL